jgi:tetratricopeptide (TPR) repeat protein
LLEAVERAVREGNWKLAFELSKELVVKYPINAKARAYLGLAHMNLADFESAALELKKAVALDPHFWQAELVLAQCLDSMGKYAEALDVALSTLKERPSDPKVQALVRGLERHVDRPSVDGWERSQRLTHYNINITHQEAEPGKEEPAEETEPENVEAEQPQLRLYISPKPTS